MTDIPDMPAASLVAKVNQHAARIKWYSIAVMVVSMLWLARTLPVDRAVAAINAWVQGLGFWGAVVFGLIYIAATVLLLPASALTLASGAVFGLAKGTITVSLASTSGAGLAFLISRYLAREKMTAFTRKYPKFDAIDRAIGEQGWKIIALLRLSPAVPFNLSNYLYGLTSIRFWTCFVVSWAAMLPGTFMYVYLGHVGGQGLAAATGAAPLSSAGQWVLLGVGLLATLIVCVYVKRLASRALDQQAQIDEDTAAIQAAAEDAEHTVPIKPTGWPWGASLAAVLALLAFSGAACAHFNPQVLQGLFGPPTATLAEAYQDKPAGPKFDHSKFDALLKQHVDADGWVDYRGFAANSAQLDEYVSSLAGAPFDDLGRDQKLALLINAYNAFTIRLILDRWDGGRLKSIKDIPAGKRWDDSRWRIGPHKLSLNQIEHEQIRPKFNEPRIHFALVCAAVGCPKLRNEAYQADRIDQQLEDQMRYAHSHDRWFRFQAGTDSVQLTKLYDWYGGDFKQVAGSAVEYAARYSADLQRELRQGQTPRIRWIDYDWRLNDKANRP